MQCTIIEGRGNITRITTEQFVINSLERNILVQQALAPNKSILEAIVVVNHEPAPTERALFTRKK